MVRTVLQTLRIDRTHLACRKLPFLRGGNWDMGCENEQQTIGEPLVKVRFVQALTES